MENLSKPPNFRKNIANTCLNCQNCGDTINPKCKKYPQFNLRVENWEESVCDDWKNEKPIIDKEYNENGVSQKIINDEKERDEYYKAATGED